MKKFLIAAILAAVAMLSVAALASGQTTAKTLKFSAALNAGQTVPHAKGTKVGAAGHFTASLSGTTLKWTLTFAHLSGTATAAHIHTGVKGKSGPVLIPLCGTCTSGATGTATVTADQVKLMESKGLYVNVHTAKNPSGEIRGQIKAAM